MLNKSEFVEAVYASALGKAASNNLKFGEGANEAIRVGIESNSKRFVDASPDEQPKLLAEAQDNVQKFVAQMILARDQIAGYREQNPNVIGELTFNKARDALCPIWPVC